jgi:hypothetical protein
MIGGTETREVEATPGLPLVYDGEVLIYENPQAMPRVWLAHEVRYVSSPEEAWQAMAQPDVNLTETALVEEYVPGIDGGARLRGKGDTAKIVRYEPNEVEVKAATAQPGMLILSDVFYPGWQATVDGEPAYIYRTYGLIRGVFLSPGEHTVVFEYRPRSFALGLVAAALSILSLSVWGIARIIGKRRRKGGAGPADQRNCEMMSP